MFAFNRKIDRSFPVQINRINVGTFADQKSNDVFEPVLSCFVKRRDVIEVFGVDVGSVFDQQFGAADRSVLSRVVKRSFPVLSLQEIGIGFQLKKRFDASVEINFFELMSGSFVSASLLAHY